jgi:hypothetical protein
MQINPVINGQPGSGCCPGAHAKVFEIVLIIIKIFYFPIFSL